MPDTGSTRGPMSLTLPITARPLMLQSSLAMLACYGSGSNSSTATEG
jgi:hypothetical protein